MVHILYGFYYSKVCTHSARHRVGKKKIPGRAVPSARAAGGKHKVKTMRDTLDLSRRRPRRWPWAAAMALLTAGFVTALLLGARELYGARAAALEQENAALRDRLARGAHTALENEALRTLVGCKTVSAALQPAYLAARWPGGFAVASTQAQPGNAVLDRRGRFAGTVTDVSRGVALVRRGTPAGLCGTVLGLLDGNVLTELPLHNGLEQGALVTTPDGHWLGTLAEPPTAAPDDLTEQARLTDTADLWDWIYFVVTDARQHAP